MNHDQDNASRSNAPLTYSAAGVDIDAGNALVERIKPAVQRTQRSEVLGGLGGFGALCKLPTGYRNPVLVAGTDGVGTKLRLALDSGVHDGVGIDLVAMCVNDLVVAGAEPLFFLDYYASAALDVDVAATVIESIARGCELAGCALVGGETAEMPGMYHAGDYDLAGFCVGVAEQDSVIDGSSASAGDTLIALASSGPHSNGYSLIRKVLERTGDSLDTPLDGSTLGETLLEPTRIYVKSILSLLQHCPVHAIAHITGGGLLENIPRVLPSTLAASIDTASWQMPPVFDWLQRGGNIARDEMYRTFNCGVGMVIAVPPQSAEVAIATLTDCGEQAWRIGELLPTGTGGERVVFA